MSDAQGLARAPERAAKALTAAGGVLFAALAVGLAVSDGRLPASNAGIDGAYVGVLFASVTNDCAPANTYQSDFAPAAARSWSRLVTLSSESRPATVAGTKGPR